MHTSHTERESEEAKILRALLGGRAGCIHGQGDAAQEVAGYYLSLAGARVRCLCFDAHSLALAKEIYCAWSESSTFVSACSRREGDAQEKCQTGIFWLFPCQWVFCRRRRARGHGHQSFPFSFRCRFGALFAIRYIWKRRHNKLRLFVYLLCLRALIVCPMLMHYLSITWLGAPIIENSLSLGALLNILFFALTSPPINWQNVCVTSSLLIVYA